MKKTYHIIIQLISYLGLALSVVPGFLVFFGKMEFESYKIWILIGTILWFVSAPFWINKKGMNETEG
jgi:high-affinity Fe2+/Pb2+ permease